MRNPYEAKYKYYILVPALLFLIAVPLALNVEKGIDLKGGNIVIAKTTYKADLASLEQALSQKFSLTGLKVSQSKSLLGGEGYSVRVEYSDNAFLSEYADYLAEAKSAFDSNDSSTVLSLSSKIISGLSSEDVPSEPKQALFEAERVYSDAEQAFSLSLDSTVKSSLGLPASEQLLKKNVLRALGQTVAYDALKAVVSAAVLIVLVVLLFFRKLLPSLAIILAAIFDVVFGLALMSLFSVPLSLASISALLMLVGYSVDTDVLLTTRLLKRREGSTSERVLSSMKTGMTMTLTTVVAVIVIIVMSYFMEMSALLEFSAALFFGLLGDLISTWLMNAPMLLWYAEKKGGRAYS